MLPVALDGRPAELAHAVHALGGPRSDPDQVAPVHDDLGAHVLQIGEHGIEGDETPVHVGEDGDSIRHGGLNGTAQVEGRPAADR